VDPNNEVVKLCVDGMDAEREGRFVDARALFERAWAAHRDDFEACIAAHYLARQQDNEQDTLAWNEEALRRADAVPDERVSAFYPSLLLNLGHSHEALGALDEARRYYALATERLGVLSDDRYGVVVRDGLARAKERIG
jgi:tetratricopeptide (TPR) repeat protein